MSSRLLLAVASFATLAAFAAPGSAAATTATYVAGGTVVVKEGGKPPAADEGAVVCLALDVTGNNAGIGGGCVAFGAVPGASSVRVSDRLHGATVPFQVCIDNDGDGVCTSPDFGNCADEIFFSHDDNGVNHNPLGPLPTGFAAGCPGGAWNGYVVFLCNGVHTAGGAHAHPASVGTITTVSGVPGTGYGTFCGGAAENAQSNKPYTVLGV